MIGISLLRTLLKLRDDRRGSVLIIFGVSFLVLAAVGGAGFDLGRQQLMRMKLQQASDAAALAGAALPVGTSDADRVATARMYYNLNFPAEFLNVPRPPANISVAGDRVQVSADAAVETSFVQFVGVEQVNARGNTIATFRRDANRLDVILVMDNSYSMGITDVGRTNSQNARMPQALNACIASRRTTFGQSTNDARNECNASGGGGGGLTGFTRINALRYSATQLVNSLIDPNPNDNRIALVTWDNLLVNSQDFTTDPASARNFLSLMFGRNNTISTVGLRRAQVFGQNFRDNATPAVILMTDGDNYFGNTPQATLNAQSIVVCDELKNDGVLMYTIAFGQVINQPDGRARAFLSSCATQVPNGSNLNQFYFEAENAEELAEVFAAITGGLQRTRIVE